MDIFGQYLFEIGNARVRNYIVDLEFNMLEESMPLTVGPGSEVIQDDDEDDEVVIVGDALEEMSEADDESDG